VIHPFQLFLGRGAPERRRRKIGWRNGGIGHPNTSWPTRCALGLRLLAVLVRETIWRLDAVGATNDGRRLASNAWATIPPDGTPTMAAWRP